MSAQVPGTPSQAGTRVRQTARLRVSGLRICLAGTSVDVVDGVSFDVGTGELMGLVGESGSGKTTIALSLLGYVRRGLEISGGRIELDGRDILALSAEELRSYRGSEIAYVPQDPATALNPALRIGTQLTEALSAHESVVGDIKASLGRVLEELQLPADDTFLRRYPHQLSGGQQQRILLAMAFACRPKIIVLDEPTTGLDVSTQRRVLDLVREMSSAYGVAGVYVSHDLAVVAGLASSLAVMYAGRLVEVGATRDIFESPAHPYTRGLLDAIPSPDRDEALRGIRGQPPKPGKRPSGCSFAPRCPLRIAKCDTPPPVVGVANRQVLCWRAAESHELGRERSRGKVRRFASGGVLLSVSRLTATYADTEVLHSVSFKVRAGSCTAIVGESGSGKTTLARCVVGLHKQYSGDITFDDNRLLAGVKARPKDTLRRVQYIFQNPYASLNPRKTVGQIILHPLERLAESARNTNTDRVRAALNDVALSEDYIERYPDELSGGERQRVAIARALVVEPDLLICDEVTSALDVSVQAVIVELLRRLQSASDLSLVFITHNLGLVRSIAQDVIVLADGNVVEAGSVSEVLDHPRAEYTATLVRNVPKVPIVVG